MNLPRNRLNYGERDRDWLKKQPSKPIYQISKQTCQKTQQLQNHHSTIFTFVKPLHFSICCFWNPLGPRGFPTLSAASLVQLRLLALQLRAQLFRALEPLLGVLHLQLRRFQPEEPATTPVLGAKLKDFIWFGWFVKWSHVWFVDFCWNFQVVVRWLCWLSEKKKYVFSNHPAAHSWPSAAQNGLHPTPAAGPSPSFARLPSAVPRLHGSRPPEQRYEDRFGPGTLTG